MKHVVEHPPKPPQGQGYWRSLSEHADSPEFAHWLDREFPQGASEFWGDGVSRRNFLRLMGASMALAGFGLSGCRRPEAYLVPFTRTPEWQIPGSYQHYATSLPRARGGVPLLMTTYDGRPTKVEGNPLHPVSKGKSDLSAQAAILDMYDPERASRFTNKGERMDRAKFFEALDGWVAAWGENGGEGLAFLSPDENSPTVDRLRVLLQEKFPSARWYEHDPLAIPQFDAAVRKAFGADRAIRSRLDQARVILSLDADFLGDDPVHGGMEAVRGFADGRRLRTSADAMNRLYLVESRMTLTSSQADHRLRVPASFVPALTVAFAKEIARRTGSAALASLADAAGADVVPGVDPQWVIEAAADLASRPGSALVMAGAHQPESVHALVIAINEALGAMNSTLEVYGTGVRPANSGGLLNLAAAMMSRQVKTLVILGSNPVYHRYAQMLPWETLRSHVETVVQLGDFEDETSVHSDWFLPRAHPFEAWGDCVLQDGSYGCVQPMILPLFGGLSTAQLLARILGLPAGEGRDVIDSPELIQETFKAKQPWLNGDFENAWRIFVRDGFLKDSRPAALAVQVDAGMLIGSVASRPAAVPALGVGNLELVFAPGASLGDGSRANNGWLQELADPITKITWDNAALVSPATATALGVGARTYKGVERGDVIRIKLGEYELEIPIVVQPGQADWSIALSLGYGRSKSGNVGTGVGVNVQALRTSAGPWIATGAVVEAAGRTHDFAITQDHWSIEGRAIVREAPLEYYKQHGNFAYKQGEESHAKPTDRNAYESPAFDYERYHQWGMVIDLTSCTGCNACVIACQAENNIPIVGKEQVAMGREMQWMRIDRYYSGTSKFRSDAGKAEVPSNPEMVMQPMTCMQCENAPCETVCPVNATVHNEEGLNLMVYNRCIGTRYCANNCPYKVRRFNFFDFNQRQLDKLYLGPVGPKGMPQTLQMQKNPNVSVRMRGVIEKCTFCVQRLEMSKIDHKVRSRRDGTKIPTDSVQTACQQSCPADAIVFGDLSDPEARVTQLKNVDRNYNVLEYLNVRPRLSYLARLRNPNVNMPDGRSVGMTMVEATSHSLEHAH